jgi:CRISPR-associated endonuclease Cas1
VVAAKGANQRTLLRRNAQPEPADALSEMAGLLEHAGRFADAEALLGLEGLLARAYFGSFARMLKQPDLAERFQIEGRSRRPPPDPVNALLSFGYALLAKECTVALMAVGLDPWWGLYHKPRHGRPALALDLMEEFRPLIGDSVVLTAINNGEVKPDDFISAMGSVSLTAAGRTRFIEAYERRMSQEITHPVFGYRISYRRVLEVQARLLGRYLAGEIPEYPSFTTR